MTDLANWKDTYSQNMIGIFGTPEHLLTRGHGVYVWDESETRYLDLLGGIAVNCLGHAHPAISEAVYNQLNTLGHISNFFASKPQLDLAAKLVEIANAPTGSGVFFANSGTEANEAAFKIARRTGKPKILALTGAFHGRTLGSLALTHKEAYRAPFEPLPGGVEFIPFGDADALRFAFESSPGQIAALFIEPIQGEVGVRNHPAGYLELARELTIAHEALLIFDEVQTGIGRTGYWFAHQNPEIASGVIPDVVTSAKGLGGGIPIGATVTFGTKTTTLLSKGQHGSTFGGNPVACAAALATINTIESEGLLAQVQSLGAWLATNIPASSSGLVKAVRAFGLLIGIELNDAIAGRVVQQALAAGYITNAVNESTIRLAPPFIINVAQLQSFVDFLAGVESGLTQNGDS